MVTQGKMKEAWETILQENPLPAVMGRICYHPCETACNRTVLDLPVSIHAVERHLGDLALENGWIPEIPEATGKRILIVGAGPSGLSCAHHLALMGHHVVIREAGPVAGGMMHFGIPAYRLPRNILDGEVSRIERMGVTILLNQAVQDLDQERQAFDAVFVAVGAHIGKKVEMPSRDAGKMLEAVQFLKDVEEGSPPKLGRKVAIYGGGNTAMDAARVARRLGVEPLIIYRRDRDHMPAHQFEADEALAEGVKIHWLRTIKSMEEGAFTVEVMELNDEGRPVPTGELETIEADDLILALGQDVDTSFMKELPGLEFLNDGSVKVDGQMMTGCPGVFAGGDMVPSERTATVAIGHGKKAARSIDAWLKGESYSKRKKGELASFDKLHLWFYTNAEQQAQPQLALEDRGKDFEEVIKGLKPEEALYEAKRCLSCGNCYECDGCYGVCPEDAIEKLGPGKGYKVNLTTCTGCGTCFEQCPCGAITLVNEPPTPSKAK